MVNMVSLEAAPIKTLALSRVVPGNAASARDAEWLPALAQSQGQ
jgi:hypothetical protein